ncbi:MAG: peptide ABC transporter substrate-binding protein, partial [Bdellovibrionota bacterium]
MARALILLCALLFGCSGNDRALQFNLGIEALQLDWNKAIDSTSVTILDNVMEGLTTYSDPVKGARLDLIRPLPALTEYWTVAEQGRVYRFRLRPGTVWTDGMPLKAQQFVDSWERLLSPATHSANAYHLFDIVNARAFADGKIKEFSQVGVKAVDDLTLEVTLRKPVPYFLHLVASPSTFPVRRDLIEKFGEQWTDPDHLVTLGPYQVSEWIQGDRIVLKSFPNYHGVKPAIDTVVCRMIAEPLTAFAMFENGELDIIPRDLPPSFARRLQAHPDYRSGPKLSVSYLLFNTRRAPFNKVENRRAFIRALDRPQLASYFQGSQTPTSSWIPPGLLGYSSDIGIPAEGKQSTLLAGHTVNVRYSGNDTWNLLFQTLQRSLAENLAVRAKLDQMDSPEYGKFLASLESGKSAQKIPDILYLGWVADYPDPHSFMNVFTSTSESNYTGWSNPAYDKLVEKAVSTADETTRAGLYREAQKLLLEDEAVIMPLFFTSH